MSSKSKVMFKATLNVSTPFVLLSPNPYPRSRTCHLFLLPFSTSVSASALAMPSCTLHNDVLQPELDLVSHFRHRHRHRHRHSTLPIPVFCIRVCTCNRRLKFNEDADEDEDEHSCT
ncbi:hypothetical protein BT96DRAFT_212625 [Gymnopus androsaceus JB14]|uniref:Uncharacterized protein n=1 Tax=Gymnopus androsaceus JB14 TaxID=1447944 RepID=A0A6A4H7I1_9AGAR|nr:hypothetical protein BT96DRAFT_212625 [Gymnopus androsaceus JB14]